MIRHIVGWNFKENIEDKEAAAKEIKRVAEAMVGKIPGLSDYKSAENGHCRYYLK